MVKIDLSLLQAGLALFHLCFGRSKLGYGYLVLGLGGAKGVPRSLILSFRGLEGRDVGIVGRLRRIALLCRDAAFFEEVDPTLELDLSIQNGDLGLGRIRLRSLRQSFRST